MAASGTASTLHRIVRIAFGVVVVAFFAGLNFILVLARSLGRAPPRNAPPDAVLVGTILLFALIAAYGLDQFLTGFLPTRSRWFTATEERLADVLERSRGRGSVTVARLWNAPVRLHWSLAVGLFLVGGLQPGAWVGFLLVIVAHEIGHAVLVRRFRQQVLGLSFHALGGECQWAGQPAPIRRALIAWGGVAGQAVLFVLAWVVSRGLPHIFVGRFGESLGHALLGSNAAMAAFNLLPVYPLDGIEAWRSLSPRRRFKVIDHPRDNVSEVVQSALERAKRQR